MFLYDICRANSLRRLGLVRSDSKPGISDAAARLSSAVPDECLGRFAGSIVSSHAPTSPKSN